MISASVCLSVSVSVGTHISETTWPIFKSEVTKFLWALTVAVTPSCGGGATCYVLPVLWMTSSPITNRMAA